MGGLLGCLWITELVLFSALVEVPVSSGPFGTDDLQVL